MTILNSKNAYGSVAKFLHWTIALLIIGMLTFGYFMEDMPEDYKGIVFNIHKLTGLTILALVAIRLCWSLFNVRPELPFGTPLWQRFSARLIQYLLNFFTILMPLAGWIGSSAAEKYPHLGDLKFMLPVPHEKGLVEASFDVHETVAIILITLVSIHVLAALYHHFIRRDDVLRKML